MADDSNARTGTAVVSALLFGSGFCALVYQTTWFREFRLIFGASTAASAAVLAVFMGGLGIGGAILGHRADRARNGLRLYALLEIGIAISAAATPLLLLLARQAYIATGGSGAFGLGGATVVRIILTALVLAIPTILMGGTLPAAARAVETGDDRGRRRLAVLYGANTVGAVAGALAGTFGMLELFGNRKTLLVAAALNVLVALIARAVASRSSEDAAETGAATARVAVAGRRRGFVFAAAALVGFAFFLMEMVWYRMLAPLLGGSTFTFGLILAAALAGIGIGGFLYSSFGESRVATLRAFAITCAAESLLIAIPFAIGDGIAVLAILLRGLGSMGFAGYVLGWSAIAAVVVVPASILAGFQFPLLIALLGEGRENVGRDAGTAYAWNTAGAIGGSLAGGFGILPLLTAPGTWMA
ncbi:MAG TPA: spermidine synthase, partial [Thermoanaerobaculia bacterium]|nr:spermidine synthase [Thermoanaerobaculia bacterium]